MKELNIRSTEYHNSVMYIQHGGRYVASTVSSSIKIKHKNNDVLPIDVISVGFKKEMADIIVSSVKTYVKELKNNLDNIINDSRSYNNIFIDILSQKLQQISVLKGEFIFTVKIGNMNIKTDYLDGVSTLEQDIIINYI